MLAIRCGGRFMSAGSTFSRPRSAATTTRSRSSSRYRDFDLNLTQLSIRTSTNAVATMPCCVVYVALLDVSR